MLRRDTPGLITPAETALRIAKAKAPEIWRMEILGQEEQRAWASFISNHDFDQLTRWLSGKYVTMPNERNGFPFSPEGHRWASVYSATRFLLDKLVNRTVIAKYLYVDGALEDLAGWECNDTFVKLLQIGGVRGKFGSLFLELYNQPPRKMDGWILLDERAIENVIAAERGDPDCHAASSVVVDGERPKPKDPKELDDFVLAYYLGLAEGKPAPSKDKVVVPYVQTVWDVSRDDVRASILAITPRLPLSLQAQMSKTGPRKAPV